MNEIPINPFTNYGNIVSGKKFIGRESYLKLIKDRISIPKEPGNIAIIGYPRIGKSSLVYKAIMENKKHLISSKKIPIWINLATFNDSKSFFKFLVSESINEISELGTENNSLIKSAEEIASSEGAWNSVYRYIQRFFKKIKQLDYHMIFILDEFDHARVLFKQDNASFQGLRELSYWPEWRVTFITTSRRCIRDIEVETQAISTLDGIFHKEYLRMFDDKDMEEYYKNYEYILDQASTEFKELINFYCGGYPYLLDMLGYEIFDYYRENNVLDVNKAAQRLEISITDFYDQLIALLMEDNRLEKLLQIIIGPSIDVTKLDINEFLAYGLIKTNIENKYISYSEHFNLFLNVIKREKQISTWDLWCKTEKNLRKLITVMLANKYGDNWIEKLEKARPKLANELEICRQAQQKEIKAFGNRASSNLVDFTYPNTLFNILFAEWDTFKIVLKKDTNYWNQRATLLSKIRNPIAHNREESLHDYEIQTAEGYCNELINLIKLYLESQANNYI